MRSSSWTAAASSPRGRRGGCCTSTSRKCCWSCRARRFRPRGQVGVLAGRLGGQAHACLRGRYVAFTAVADDGAALRKVTQQQVDLLLGLRPPGRYWVDADSPQGYIVEKLLLAAELAAVR